MVEFAALGIKIDSSQVLAGKVALDKLSAAGKKTQATADKIKGKFDRLKKSTRSLSTQMLSLKSAMLSAGVVLAFRQAIIAGAAFEQSIADLSAITGATGKDLKFLSDAAKEFGATTTLSASQVADAFKLVASAKPDLLANLPALKAVTAQTILLAQAASIDVPAAANVLGTALNQFGASANRAAEFVNVLAAGAKFGSSEIVATASALQKAGIVAKGASVSFLSLNAAIQVLAKGGQKAEIAGTGLKGVLLKLSTRAKAEFNPAVVGLSQAFQNMKDAGLGTTEMLELFQEEGFTAGKMLIDNVELLKQFEETLKGTNTAAEQAATKVNTLGGDWKKFKSVVEDAAIFFTETLNPVLRLTVNVLADLVSASTFLGELFTGALQLGMLLVAKAALVAKGKVLLLWDAITFGGEKASIFAQMNAELRIMDALILKTIEDAKDLLDPKKEAVVDSGEDITIKKLMDGAAIKNTLVNQEVQKRKEGDEAILENFLNGIERQKEASAEAIKDKEDFHTALQAGAKEQIAIDDAIIVKRIANEKQANSTIKTMREQNQNALIALARTAAGGDKAALLAILAAETALSIARITAATEAAAAVTTLSPGTSAAIRAQGALSRTLVLGAAAVGAAGILGQADDGLANVPKSGTFMLSKGERVVKPADNKLLTKALERGQFGGAPTIIVQVDATGSATVDEVVERAAQRGAEKGYELVAEDMRRGGPIRTVIR